MKKILLISLFLLIFSCNKIDEKCSDNDIWFISEYNYQDIKNTCDYKEKLLENIYYNNSFNVNSFYELSNVDLNLWFDFFEYFLKNNDISDISLFKQAQLYFIFRDFYNFDDNYIKNNFWIKIDNKIKKYSIDLDRVVLGENLLTQNFDNNSDDWYITNNELSFLYDMFMLDCSQFDNINLVAEYTWIYNYLDNEWKKIFIEMLEDVYNNTSNESTKSIVWDFLDEYWK